MKRIKILFACFFAVALGAGVSAFNFPTEEDATISTINVPAKEKKEIRGPGKYRYTITSDVITDLQEPSNWEPVEEEETPDCDEVEDIPCYVNSTATNFDTYVANASLNDLMQIAVEFKAAQ